MIPKGIELLPKYRYIDVKQSHFSKFWTQGVFAITCRLKRAIPINLCNEVSILAPKGICALHDVCYAEESVGKMFPDEERKWFCKIYKRIKMHSIKIVTVSQFSKQRIENILGIESEKIIVASNGWQHFKEIDADESVFDRFQTIKKGNYYFTVSSSNPNKNVKWIIENAKIFPENQYVIGGKNIDHIIDFSKYSNVIYVGFLEDTEMKSLMKHCKAFLFPSIYEGFGIPPIEALSVGADIIVSNTASLPEIFEDAAHYINPENVNVDINALIKKTRTDGRKVLEKYSWEKSAGIILELLRKW